MFASSLFRGHRKVPALFSAVVLCRWHCVVHLCSSSLLSRSVCLSLSPGGSGSCPVCRAVGQEACAHLVFRGLRASPVGCNFALLTGTQGDSAGDFLSDRPLLSTVLSVGKERMGGSCDGAGPAPSAAAVFSLTPQCRRVVETPWSRRCDLSLAPSPPPLWPAAGCVLQGPLP